MARVTFVLPDGARRVLDAAPGRTVLEIAWEHGIGIEGACEGAMACSTCHVVLSEGDFDRLPAPSEDEEDMLDIAWGVTPTSRLGCQIGKRTYTLSTRCNVVQCLGDIERTQKLTHLMKICN